MTSDRLGVMGSKARTVLVSEKGQPQHSSVFATLMSHPSKEETAAWQDKFKPPETLRAVCSDQ